MNKRLYRSTKDSKVAGVCGGIADFFNIDPVLIRISFIFLTFFGLFGIFLYIVLAIVIPIQPVDGANAKVEDKKQPQNESDSIEKDFENLGKNVENLGKNFGAKMEDLGNNFGTKMEDFGKDFGAKMENFGKEIEEKAENFSKNSTTGKFFLSVIGTLFIGLGATILIAKFCPYFRFEFYFPTILILCGVVLILFSFNSKSK
jgi:phage shock protein PspC (stress-responsive transcriptional regulator)